MEAEFHAEDKSEIEDALQNVVVGDEISITTERGYEEQAKVHRINGDKQTALFGNPQTDSARVLDLQNGCVALIGSQSQWIDITSLEFFGQ